MSKAIDRLRKRGRWPVKLAEDTVYIRAMVKGEQREAREVSDDELRGYFIFGTILLEDDGAPSYPRVAGESPDDFAKRIDAEMADVPEDHKMALLTALAKASSVPENLAKN